MSCTGIVRPKPIAPHKVKVTLNIAPRHTFHIHCSIICNIPLRRLHFLMQPLGLLSIDQQAHYPQTGHSFETGLYYFPKGHCF